MSFFDYGLTRIPGRPATPLMVAAGSGEGVGGDRRPPSRLRSRDRARPGVSALPYACVAGIDYRRWRPER